MIYLAYRNLIQNQLWLMLSIGGVALAFVLMLSLDAIFSGVEQQITAYMDHSGADVFVSQSGVRNMHMTSSSLPASIEYEVATMDGVEAVTPILFVGNIVNAGENRYPAYVIGLPDGAEASTAWEVVEGRSLPQHGEAVIDQSVAKEAGIELGETVEILDRDFEVIGLARGTSNLVNSIAFVHFDDFAKLRSSTDTASFLLVEAELGESSEGLAARIEQYFDVTALTVYTATLARRSEYGVLKVLRAHNLNLYRVVLAQATLSVMLGFALGLAITLALSVLIPLISLNLALHISPESLLRVGIISLVISVLSALLPTSRSPSLIRLVFSGNKP